jgi:hypothetical protein
MSLAAFLLASPISAFSTTRHWIKEVSDEGGVIILEDNTVWGVESIDKLDSALWLAVPLLYGGFAVGYLASSASNSSARSRSAIILSTSPRVISPRSGTVHLQMPSTGGLLFPAALPFAARVYRLTHFLERACDRSRPSHSPARFGLPSSSPLWGIPATMAIIVRRCLHGTRATWIIWMHCAESRSLVLFWFTRMPGGDIP